ncbi:cell wall elongation regulator TseB-like domain-containing protein [Virgibacillus sp. W0181]|uniref:cell wall elongation regulator TseB-like domain-containing protein n=1 Tax=Virgibacillus sp. W0181 TaxID=3391581 RepID=UPI003F46A105
MTFIGIILAFLIVFIYFIVLYNQMMQIKTEGYAESEKRIMNETSIVEIDKITSFHEKDAYHVVWGKTAEEVNKLAFVPLTNDDPIEIIKKSEMMAEDSIVNQWERNCNDCNFIKIVPGIVEDQPVWELTYTDKADRYVFDYLSIYDGSAYEQFRFSTMFK